MRLLSALALLFLLLPLGLGAPAWGEPRSATDALILKRLSEAEAAIHAEDATRAAAIVRDLVRDFPGDHRPYLTASYLEFLKGNLEGAVHVCTYSLHIRPSTGALVNLTRLYLKQRRVLEAVNAARRAVAMDPDSPLPHLRLAQAYERDNLPNLTEETLQRILKVFPEYTPALMVQAKNYVAQGQYPEAKAILQDVLERSPDHSSALVMMGRALLTMEDEKGASKYLRRALDLHADSADAHRYLAEAAVRAGRSEEAEAHFREAIRLDEEDMNSLFQLATCLRRNGKREEAKAVLTRYRNIQKHAKAEEAWREGTAEDSPLYLWKRAYEGDPAGALAPAIRAVSKETMDPTAQFTAASCYILLGSPELAEPYIRVGQFTGPLYSMILSNLGGVLFRTGNAFPARGAWMKALYAEPAFFSALDPLILTEFQISANAILRIPTAERSALQREFLQGCQEWITGANEEATERFRGLTKEHPDDLMTWMHLALACTGNHDWTEAVGNFEKAAGEGPMAWNPAFLCGVALANSGRESEAVKMWDRIGMDYSFSILPAAMPQDN